MSDPVRVGVVGLGEIAMSAHIPALKRNTDVQIVAVVDPDEGKRDVAAAELSASALGDVSDLLERRDVCAVVLATPPWVTSELVGPIVRSGRYVLAEKPIADSVAATAPLGGLTAAERNRIQVGLTYRHDPALETLHGWIRAGRLGSPLLVRAHIYDEVLRTDDPAHYARIVATLRSGMPVVHEGAHVFDWLDYLFEAGPERIEDAWAMRTRSTFEYPNVCGARLTYPRGIVALVEFGWLTTSLPRCEISLLGDTGHAILDGSTFELHLFTAEGNESFRFEPDRTTRCFDRQLSRFVDLVRGVRSHPNPDLADGLAALELSERVARLAEEGA